MYTYDIHKRDYSLILQSSLVVYWIAILPFSLTMSVIVIVICQLFQVKNLDFSAVLATVGYPVTQFWPMRPNWEWSQIFWWVFLSPNIDAIDAASSSFLFPFSFRLGYGLEAWRLRAIQKQWEGIHILRMAESEDGRSMSLQWPQSATEWFLDFGAGGGSIICLSHSLRDFLLPSAEYIPNCHSSVLMNTDFASHSSNFVN